MKKFIKRTLLQIINALQNSKLKKIGDARFVLFLAVLLIIYIGNTHYAIKNMVRLSDLEKELRLLESEYKTLMSRMMQSSTQTEVADMARTMKLKTLTRPPKIIQTKEE